MGQITFTRYDPETGRIHSKVNCHDSDYAANAALYPDFAILNQDSDLETDYVDLTADPVVLPRPVVPGFDKTSIAADDTDTATLALPVPFAAEIDGQVFDVSTPNGSGDYVLELSSPMPGTYRVRVRLWPYQDYDAEVVAS